MKKLLVVLFVALSAVFVAADDAPIYSLGFDYPLGDTTRFEPQDGFYLTGGYEYREHAFYSSCPVIYGSDGQPLNWNISHPGLDINSSECPACDRGEPVYAASSGLVLFAGISWGNQNNILIQHWAPPNKAFLLPDGSYRTVMYTLYAHMETITVSAGEIVYRGERIGAIGDYPRGSNQNSHLHFEVRKSNLAQNYFCGNNSDSRVDTDYADPYAFIALNRGVNLSSGLTFTHNLSEITPTASLSAQALIQNHSRHWVMLSDTVVALERYNPATGEWDTAHPIDLETTVSSRALGPFSIATFFPSLTRYRYHVTDRHLSLTSGRYRAKLKALVGFGSRTMWYDIPEGGNGTVSIREFNVSSNPTGNQTTLGISDTEVEQLGTTTYKVTWTAPGTVAVVGSAMTSTPVSSYDIRVSTSPITPSNFQSATPVSAPAPNDPGELEEQTFVSTSTPVYVGIAPDNNSGNLSNIDYVKPDCTVPDPVENIHSTEVTTDSIKLTWNTVAHAEYIEIYRRTDGESVFDLVQTLPPAATWYMDTGLSEDTLYGYQLVAVNQCGAGPVETVLFRRTETFTPPPPAETHPDLVVTDLVIPAFGNVDGQNFDIYVTIENRGNGSAENVDIRSYQSEGTIIYGDDYRETSEYNVDFEAGETKTIWLLIDTPYQSLGRNYSIGVWADFREEIVETSETNNKLDKQITYVDFEPVDNFTCEGAVSGETVCAWNRSHYEEFSLWDSTLSVGRYDGTEATCTVTLAPGSHELYLGAFDTETNSYGPYAGPVRIDVEAPEAPENLNWVSSGQSFTRTDNSPGDETLPRKVDFHYAGNSSGIDVTIWRDELNNTIVSTVFNDSTSEQTFSLPCSDIRTVQFSEESTSTGMYLFLQNGLMTSTYYSHFTSNGWTTPVRIRRESVYRFNFDRVLFWAAGDFDGDGATEIGSWYLYPGGTRRQVFYIWQFSAPDTLEEPISWYETNAYSFNPDYVPFWSHGDFNGDGREDLAMLYRYPNGSLKEDVLVFRSAGDRMEPSEPWLRTSVYQFNFDRVRSVETGDPNGDRLDDLVVYYDYGTSQKLFVLPSTGRTFSLPESWSRSFNLQRTHPIMDVIDQNHDQKADLTVRPYYR